MLAKTKVTEHTIPISDLLALRLYSDARPHHHLTTNLQKGLVLVCQESELVGEGTGFGVPIVRFRDKEYFSGSSTLRIIQEHEGTTAIKRFSLDVVSERRVGKVKIENKKMGKLVKRLEELYQKHAHSTMLMSKIFLLKSIGVQYGFAPVNPVGHVTVTYRVDSPLINVKADIELPSKDGLQKFFLLNEQGSRYFRRYSDASGRVLLDKHIGAWENVEAEWACVSNRSGEVGFRLWNVKDGILRRGREFLKGTFDWVGLDYEVHPGKTRFEYDIEVFGGAKLK